ncbi:hypothetical protein PR048_023383 [Dryococelus australis]|uniref:Uncharacterized protein n=1 Tax=Dryococelus australis TaxID=614101 RepID=A0ABQ9GTX6_9NEOP|nr:hypothetical protein PR048_023383 [Dryococelus australis]
MNPENRRGASEQQKNQTVKRKLVSELTEIQKRERHPENSICKENKNNETHVVTQELNEQTMCQLGPSQDISIIQRIDFLENEITLLMWVSTSDV